MKLIKVQIWIDAGLHSSDEEVSGDSDNLYSDSESSADGEAENQELSQERPIRQRQQSQFPDNIHWDSIRNNPVHNTVINITLKLLKVDD